MSCENKQKTVFKKIIKYFFIVVITLCQILRSKHDLETYGGLHQSVGGRRCVIKFQEEKPKDKVLNPKWKNMPSMLYLFPGPREDYIEELQFLGEEDNVNYQLVTFFYILTLWQKTAFKDRFRKAREHFVANYAWRLEDGTIHPSETWNPKLSVEKLKHLRKQFREDLLAYVPREVTDPKAYIYRLMGLVTRTREVRLLKFI